jgi:hypothetical protein
MAVIATPLLKQGGRAEAAKSPGPARLPLFTNFPEV